MMAGRFTTTMAWVLSALLVLTPTMRNLAYAQSTPQPQPSPFDQAAQEGQAFGRNQMPDPTELFGHDETSGNYTIFPDSGDTITITPQELFGDGHGTTADVKDLYGHDRRIDEKTANATTRLETEASYTGEAYRAVVQSTNRYHPDISNDPVFDTSSQVMEDIFSGVYSACEVTENIVSTSTQEHIPDYRFCNRVVVPEGSCTIYHEYKTRVIKHVGGALNIQKCSATPLSWWGRNRESYPANWGCFYLWVGKTDFNGDGSGVPCEHRVREMTLKVLSPGSIMNATLTRVYMDDYTKISINGQQIFIGPDSNLPPEGSDACDLGEGWSVQISEDVTRFFNNLSPEDTLNVRVEAALSDDGAAYGRIRVLYDKAKAITHDQWEASNKCKTMAEAVLSGTTNGSLTCVAGSNSTGCANIAGFRTCADWLKPSPYEGISPLCKRVLVEAEFTLNEGGMSCWTDPQGNQHCPNNEGEDPNGCEKFESDGSCVYVESECIEGAVLPSGRCYAYTAKYDCGMDVDVPTSDIRTEYSCPGGVRCKGGDCLTITTNENNDFAHAVAVLQAADQIAMDMSCPNNVGAGNNVLSCDAFDGEAMECKTAVGGVVNCCKQPQSGVSLTDYITLMRATRKVAGLTLGKVDALHGTWTKITQPITDAWNSVTNYFASALDANGAALPAKKIGLDQLKQMAMKKVAKFIAKTFGKQAAGLFFAGVGTEGGKLFLDSGQMAGKVQLGGFVGSALSVVMTVYTVYVVAKLIIHMVWKCTKKELQLGVKRRLKSTHYVGSYCKTEVLGACVEERRVFCTFSSPLSRILQEQLRPQLGVGWGSPEDPNCQGLTVLQISQADWSKVDLGEWIAILKTTGHLPSGPAEAMAQYSSEGLTADVPVLDFNNSRKGVAERNKERLASNETLERNEALRQELWASGSDDVSFPPPLPEPSICEPGHRFFYHVGAPQFFRVPEACQDITIIAEAGDSGFATNIPTNPGEYIEKHFAVEPEQKLKIIVGSGGNVQSNWNAADKAGYYWGEAGGPTKVYTNGSQIIDLAGGAETGKITQRATDYFQGEDGYVLIIWGGASVDVQDWQPEPQPLPDPPEPVPPCAAGQVMYAYTGNVVSFEMPENCHTLTVTVNGAGGGGGGANGSATTGGNGARVTGRLTVAPGTTLNILVGQGGYSSTIDGVKAECHTRNTKDGTTEITCYPVDVIHHGGSGGGRSAVLTVGGTPLLVAGGGGGASARTNGADAGLDGSDGKGVAACTTGGTQTSGGSGAQGGSNGTRKTGGHASMALPQYTAPTAPGHCGKGGCTGGNDPTPGWNPGVDFFEFARPTFGGGGKGFTGGGGGGGYYGGGGGGVPACSGGAGSSYIAPSVQNGQVYKGGGSAGGRGHQKGGHGTVVLQWGP